MSANFLAALQITAIGMSLVFAAILLMWGVMAVLMRLTQEKEKPPEAEVEAAPPAEATRPTASDDGLKRRAVAVAVAVALAHDTTTSPPPPRESPLPPTAIVSAWQAVTRARQLTQRGPRR